MSGSLNERSLFTTGIGLALGIDRGGSLTLPVGHFFGALLLRGGRYSVGFLSFINSVGMDEERDSSWSPW